MARRRDDWFKAAYPDCLAPLCRYLERFVGSPEMAEDLAHDAFLRVYTAPDFDEIRSPRGYLFRTARNLALNFATRHGLARTEPMREVACLVDEDTSVEHQAITEEELDLLCVAIARLSPQRRKVLTLRIFYDYSCQQIADRLGVSLRTVHRDLARALEAVHAARKSMESGKGSPLAQVIALRRREKHRR
ncbi:MAG TPA: sigma-70 family RNA polymerase sigma factor [Woeseiaceae bacterium]|nr:sigma-70 family RNA polymerase sigma factor [Woeseiaceae bacterium]